MGPEGIVLLPPSLDKHLGLRQRVEQLPVQELVPEFPVQRLHISVLPGAAWLDKESSHIQTLEPVPDQLRRELGAVVAADVGW